MEHGGTPEEARDAFVSTAKITRAEMLSANSIYNILNNNAYYNQQILFNTDGNFDLTDKYILYRLGYEERHPTQEIHEPYYTAFNPTFSWYDSKVRVTYLENVNLFRNVPPFHPPGTEVWHTDEKGNLVDRLMWVCGYDKMPGEHFREPLYCVTPSINYSVDPECVLFSVEGESHRPSAERRNSWFSSDE